MQYVLLCNTPLSGIWRQDPSEKFEALLKCDFQHSWTF